MPSSRFVFAVLLALAAAGPSFAEESPVTVLQGTLEVAVEDDFARGTGLVVYALVDDEGQRTPLSFTAPPAELHTGMRLTLTGRMREGLLEVDSSADLAAPSRSPAARKALAGGPRSVIVILLNFLDDMSQPYLASTVQNTVFGAGGSVGAFYSENSFGQTTLTGTVTNWLTATVNKPTTCDIGTIQSQAESRASAAGYNPYNYQYRVYVFPSVGACGWAGLGVVGGSGAWINQAVSTYVVGHELGHNFGVLHAHSLDCGSQSFGPSCSRSEYGDPFDIMGGAARHFSAYHKSVLGFLPPGTVATHTAGGATYTLSALESPGGTTYAVQIPTSAGRTYWLEFRQAIGFDAGLSGNPVNGALVHIGPSDVGGADLLDMTPVTTPGNFGDAALAAGSTFTDAAAGLVVGGVVHSGSTLSIQVQLGTSSPTGSFTFSPASPAAGHSVWFTDTSMGSPTTWLWSFGDGTTSSLQNPVHAYAAGGTFTASLTASNLAGTSAPFTRTISVSPPVPVAFHTLPPCRLVDTRNASGPYGGPALAAGNRAFVVQGQCGVPAGARVVAANVTVTAPSAAGLLILYAGGTPVPNTSSINFRSGQTRANNALIELGTSGDILVSVGLPGGTVQFILDVTGYFQ